MVQFNIFLRQLHQYALQFFLQEQILISIIVREARKSFFIMKKVQQLFPIGKQQLDAHFACLSKEVT